MSSSDDERSGNVALALSLVLIAGAATGLGAAVVFFPSIVKLASRRVLAGSLGFSAGVMSYVSFIEIFQKAQQAFMKGGHSEAQAYSYSTLCFFGGVLIMMILNVIVGSLLGGHSHRGGASPGAGDGKGEKTKSPNMSDDSSSSSDGHNHANFSAPPCCTKDPVGRLEKIQNMANELQEKQGDTDSHGEDSMNMDVDIEDDFVDNMPLDDDKASDLSDDDEEDEEDNNKRQKDQKTAEENKRLVTMGMNTAIAIGLHNFPEGLATFVAALEDPRVGAVLATAIAIHNIPEGLCVALPIFYATGKRTNAFLWALLSGASEVVAALLGWAILANSLTQDVYGILFGFVAGMMIIITVRELLPTAHFYDPEDTVVTYSFIGGMTVMATSLVLFKI